MVIRRWALPAVMVLLASLVMPDAAPAASAGPSALPPDTRSAVADLRVAALTTTNVTLAWRLTTSGRRDQSIEVLRVDGDTPPVGPTDGTPVAVLSGDPEGYTDSGLTAGATYSYAVFGLDAHARASALSTATALASTGDGTTGFAGRVTDSRGRPIAGVMVNALRGSAVGPSARTDDTGAYAVTGLAAGRYSACFLADAVTGGSSGTGLLDRCYGTSAMPPNQLPAPIAVATGSVTLGVDESLRSAGMITGTVADSAGRPLSGVTVSAFRLDPATPPLTFGRGDTVIRSTATGGFRLPGLAAGSWSVCFTTNAVSGGRSRTGYARECYDNQPPAGNPTPVPVRAGEVTAGVDAQLADGGVLTGFARGPDGQPVAGVPVEVIDQSGDPITGALLTRTDSTGRYRAAGLRAGTYQACSEGNVVATSTAPNGYVPSCPPPTKEVTAGQTSRLDITMALGAGIDGVITGPDGAPLSGALAETDYGDALSDRRGRFHVGGLSGGPHTICFDAAGVAADVVSECYDNQAYDPSNFNGLTKINLTAGMAARGDASLAAGIDITGLVADTSGQPISGVLVSATTAGWAPTGARTGRDGSYSLRGLVGADYRVCFFDYQIGRYQPRHGYASQCFDGQSTQGQSTPVHAPATGVDAALVAAGEISGRVSDTEGMPVDGAFVYLFTADGHPLYPPRRTYTDGAYDIPRLAPATYQVCFVVPSDDSLAAQCYSNKPFSSPDGPVNGDPVVVRTDRTTAGVDVVLQPRS